MVKKENVLKKGILLLVIYLAINSNLFHSIILIAFILTNLLFELIKIVKDKKITFVSLYNMLKNNIDSLIILILWGIALIFEASGGRASYASASIYNLPVKESWAYFINAVKNMNKYFLSATIIIILGALIVFFLSKQKNLLEIKYIDLIEKELMSFTITLSYLLLLSAKVNPQYISKNIVLFGVMFYIFMLIFTSIVYLIKKISVIRLLLPFAVYILLFETIINGRSYADNFGIEVPAEVVKSLDDDIISQVVSADKSDVTEVVVYIPKYADSEWPISVSYGGIRISNTLFRHGIISENILITLIPSEDKNNEFHIP